MDLNEGLTWLGFWIFAAVFVACDTYVYLHGHDSFFQTHETPQEKELQMLKIEELKLKIKLHKQRSY